MFKRQSSNFKCRCNCGCQEYHSMTLTDRIRENLSGKFGELTAIFTYLFQHSITKNEKIKDALEEVALDEMEHMEKLSYLLIDLGEMPYYYDGNKNFHTTKWVNYEENPKVFLQQNIEAEKRAIKDYMDLIESTDNQNVVKTILSIIDDEKEHIEIFKRLQETVNMSINIDEQN